MGIKILWTLERVNVLVKDELEIIKQAILNEVEGYEFYKLASAHGSGAGKEAFIDLANEELKHIEYLKKLFEQIKNSQEDDFHLAFIADPPSPDIYKWNKVGKDLSSMAMSVFSIGMQMEKDSIDFYQNAKETTNFSRARELYSILIKWEKVHLDQFTGQYNLYKEEWWNDQGFAPF